MKTQVNDATVCPLCKKDNACGNIKNTGAEFRCWCQNSAVIFPEDLLEQLHRQGIDKRCVCLSCVEKFKAV